MLLVAEGLDEAPTLHVAKGQGRQAADHPVVGRQEQNGSSELGKEASPMVCTY